MKLNDFLKFIIIGNLISGIAGVTSVRDDANWFKKGGRIKNRFVTGVVNGIFQVNCDEPAKGGSVQGECMSKLECSRNGGKIGTHCSILGVCCLVEKTCGETVSTKLSYFASPEKFESDCSLAVNVINKDVCQIRLDFEEFDLAQPTSSQIQVNGEAASTSYQCQTDSFKVDEVKKNLGFSSLCGKNKGQHIYVPVADNQDRIVLRFNLKARSDQNEDEPKWRIRIRQLECQKNGHDQHVSAASKLMGLYQSLKNKKHHVKPDHDLIAPSNCLQYYPETNGQFESFNYDNGNGLYIGPMNYAICFRKTPDVCAVKYTSESMFQMNYNPFRGPDGEFDSCHPKLPASPVVSQDYIRIPGGIDTAREFKDNYCNTDFNQLSSTVVSKTHEPLYLGVHTDEFLANRNDPNPDDFQEIGFRLKYELESGNCDGLP